MNQQIFLQKSEERYIDQTREIKSLSDQQYSIEMFLNEDVFIKEQTKKQNKNLENYPKLQREVPYKLQSHLTYETPTVTKRKSIFHNFQKHLITLLKKIINIQQCPSNDRDDFELIASLWLAFLKCKTFNKKIMHTVFGCASNKNSLSQFKAISQQFKEFNQVLTKYQPEEIVQAQQVIREVVVSQAKNLSRSAIESNTNISRFEEFYAYFLSFLQEIECGQMSKRMSKIRKIDLVKKLAKKSQTQ